MTELPGLYRLHALTLHRPWDELIRRGIKRIENRTWVPDRRLPPGRWFAIHAGKKYDRDGAHWAARLPGVPIEALRAGPDSVITCLVRYAGVTRRSDDPWFVGPVGILLDRVVSLKPVPCKGAQGLWMVPPDVVEQIRLQIVGVPLP